MKTVKLARKKALSFYVNQTLIKKFIENFTFLPQYIKKLLGFAFFTILYNITFAARIGLALIVMVAAFHKFI